MKFGVLVFPGSNCDHDTHHVLGGVMGQPVTYLWHESHSLEGCDAILVPGGFAYGDYLRTGAIARFAPIMQSVCRFAGAGGLVMGICNGFQILCEAGLLPGALMRNAGLRYICKQVHLRVEADNSPFTGGLERGRVLRMPIGHMEGNYFCDAATLDVLKRHDRIAFRYANAAGGTPPPAQPPASPRTTSRPLQRSAAGVPRRAVAVPVHSAQPDHGVRAFLATVLVLRCNSKTRNTVCRNL